MINRHQLNVMLSYGIGTGLGALTVWQFTKRKFEARLDREIEDVKANYRYIRKDDYETPTDFIKENRPDILDEELAVLEEKTVNAILEHAKLNEKLAEEAANYQTGSVFNAFENETGDKDLLPADANETLYENLKATRSDAAPYLISVSEYFDDNPHFQKQTITYFAGDNVVCFEDDSIMLDPDSDFGTINLDRFGVMSDSDHIVYVRNPLLDIDWEIVKETGKYSDMIAHIQGSDFSDEDD
jgi:hypothetical protein